jgi:ribonuclease Y
VFDTGIVLVAALFVVALLVVVAVVVAVLRVAQRRPAAPPEPAPRSSRASAASVAPALVPAATVEVAPAAAALPTQPTEPPPPPPAPAPPVVPPVAPIDAALLIRRAREEAEVEISAIRADIREQRVDLERREHRLTEREERLDLESRHVEQRARELADHHAELDSRQAELNVRRAELGNLEEQRRLVLERTAGLTAEAARSELVATIENQARRDAAVRTRDIEHEAQLEGDLRARRIITGAIQRLATEQTAESVVSVLHLPSDDMKGRIIGREGRNIRTFEAVTGVNLIIDDTPEAVLLSCFDPVRREVGRIALEALVLDGRIHPQRIEDAHDRARAEVEALCVRAGEDALVDVGITEMQHELVAMLGRLRYRTSYGQNVLKHLLESAHIAGMMASELGLDPALMRRCALLHDVGKALTHEVEGSHASIGAEVARKYGENDDVVHAIEAHHNEVEPRTLEAVLTQAADAISGGRPGARRESLEAYVKRLERLEEIGMAHEGVEKVFAMQAGREVRVMVLPDAVDDIQAQVIAREIAKQVEHELSYPGQIRVTVVRESRATEVAR